MRNEFYLTFENGMPKTTAQQRGECIRYRIINGKRVPYIHHFTKEKVSNMRTEFEYKLKKHKPKEPSSGPVRLTLVFYFDIKGPKKAWGTYKTTKPDADNFAKCFIDAMTSQAFWKDDAQIADLHVVKYFAEKATIFVRVEDIEP